ncbi:hypothetical protein K469DRAFT_749116 [Zopfia rhizophila CBS 207.26]|uniref:Uncharacterized protein n=1 Tax=Zopfia rhizophila CBS 207.26 TaxID=1314779 RepID=A0A6A6EBU3_9PEZI|nr:hypothetical protein K469DRAFT_749116 [Zopfia rhizophila CBS 207.26]
MSADKLKAGRLRCNTHSPIFNHALSHQHAPPPHHSSLLPRRFEQGCNISSRLSLSCLQLPNRPSKLPASLTCSMMVSLIEQLHADAESHFGAPFRGASNGNSSSSIGTEASNHRTDVHDHSPPTMTPPEGHELRELEFKHMGSQFTDEGKSHKPKAEDRSEKHDDGVERVLLDNRHEDLG